MNHVCYLLSQWVDQMAIPWEYGGPHNTPLANPRSALPQRLAEREHNHQTRRIESLVAFISFSLMLTTLGLLFMALDAWHS